MASHLAQTTDPLKFVESNLKKKNIYIVKKNDKILYYL